jgi:branched-chain amino acid transport system permease protein
MMFDAAGIMAYGSTFLTMTLVSGIACLGLNTQWGQMGLFNVGVAGFVAIGAYTSALLTTAPVEGRLGGFAWPMACGWLAAIAVSGTASALLGAATLRLKSDYLAITTFGMAVVVQVILRNAQHLTGGSFGISFIPRPFESLAPQPGVFGLANLALTVALVAVIFIGLQKLFRSPWGRVLRGLRDEPHAAQALGKSATRYRLQAFTVGGAIMGLAGALQAHLIGFIAPDNFEAALTFQIWTMVIIGGSGNNWGVLLGAGLVSAIWSATGLATAAFFPAEFQARAAALRVVAIGALLAATVVLRPRGLLPAVVPGQQDSKRGADPGLGRHFDGGVE